MRQLFLSFRGFSLVLMMLLCAIAIAPNAAAQAGWRTGASLPSAVPDAVVARDGSQLYVMSGALGAGMRPFFELYDLRDDSWRPLTPIPRLASRFAIAADKGRVFVTGGIDANTRPSINNAASDAPSDVLWIYAPETALWIRLGTLPTPRAGHVSVAFDNQLFVLGGIGAHGARVDSYGLASGQWKSWPMPMLAVVSNAAHVKFGEELVLAGGTDKNGHDVSIVQAFNMKTGKWRRLPDLPIASSGGALVALNGRLHYLGGYSQSQQKVHNSHLRLDKNKWQKQAAMPQGRHQMGAAAYGNRLVLIGGALGGGFYALFTGSDNVSIFEP